MCQESLDELEDLVKFVKLNRREYKKEAQTRRHDAKAAREFGVASEAGGKSGDELIDVTDDILNCFVHFDVQRRFFNIVTMEILAMQFGLKTPVSVTDLKKGCTPVSLSNLVVNGRNMTMEQYFEYKAELESNRKEMEQLVRDRMTNFLFEEDGENEPNSALLEYESNGSDSLRSQSGDESEGGKVKQTNRNNAGSRFESSASPRENRNHSLRATNNKSTESLMKNRGGKSGGRGVINRDFNFTGSSLYK